MSSRRLVTSPAFQFYPQDWLVGTQGMSLAAKGAYIQIIAFGWLKGALTFDLNELAKLIGCMRAELDDVWPEVLPKLRETKRGFVNRRVEQSRGVLRRYRESKRKAALARWAKTKQPPAETAAPPFALAHVNGTPKPLRVKPTPPADQDFDVFWARYPNKKGKQAARKAWAKIQPTTALVMTIQTALEWQERQPQWVKDGGRFVPHAATWLNGRRWEDEPFHTPTDATEAAWDRVLARVASSGDR